MSHESATGSRVASSFARRNATTAPADLQQGRTRGRELQPPSLHPARHRTRAADARTTTRSEDERTAAAGPAPNCHATTADPAAAAKIQFHAELACRASHPRDPSIQPIEEPGPANSERRIIEDLIARDNRFKSRAHEMAELVIEAKRQALSDEPPDKILELIRVDPGISMESMASALGLTRKGVEWQVRKLKQSGKLRRLGPDCS